MKKIIGFTSGCFDLFHPGHAWFLNNCKNRCDTLIVAVARDKITSRKRTPTMNEKQRLYIIQNIRCVDFSALEFKKIPPKNIKQLIKKYKPDFYFTNDDNFDLRKYKEILKEMNVKLVILKRNNRGIFNISTTKMLEKIKK